MRVIGEIPHPACKITLFQWNNRYLIKFETGYLEQTFKIDQFNLESENDLQRIVNEEFITEALERFEHMNNSLSKTLHGI